MSESLDHQRVHYANQALLAQSGTLAGARTQEDIKDFRSLALKAGADLQHRGLLQCVTFWLSKDKDQHRALVRHIMGWLRECPRTVGVNTGQDNGVALIGALAGLSPSELRLLDDEAVEIVSWIKRLTEAKHKSLPERHQAQGES